MKLTGLGITLRRLQASDIELVRLHRNSPEIRKRMEFREYISKEQQKLWFESVNNDQNYYFITEWNGKPVGLIYGSQMNWDEGVTGNGGIFYWEQSLLESHIPVTSALLLSDFSFIIGIKEIYASILSDNLAGIAFNTGMGYEILPEQDGVYKQRYVLRAEAFYRKSRKLIENLGRNRGGIYQLQLDVNDPASLKLWERISVQPPEQRMRIEVIW